MSALRATVYFIAACLGPAMTAQTSATTFEVVSIKASRPDDLHTNINFNERGLSTENTTLIDLLKLGYGLNTGSEDQIAGVPAWASTARFDIDAKEDEANAAAIDKLPLDQHRMDAVRPMIQNLLIERFHLKAHTELQPRTVVALVLAKGGSKLKPATACVPSGLADQACPVQGFQGLHNDGHGYIQGRVAGIALQVVCQ